MKDLIICVIFFFFDKLVAMFYGIFGAFTP